LKYTVQAGWADTPHLSEDAIATMIAAIPPHEREARMNGVPSIGAGAIYPLGEDTFVVPDFSLPDHYPRGFGMDVGWNRTAALWGAWNQDTDIVYVYSEHYAAEAIPAVHADAIKARGAWVRGVIDPAARGRSQVDGAQLVEIYRALGLDLEYANNTVSAGIYEVWQRLVSGRLKVFESCASLRAEMKLYRRDEKGKIVKVKDHAVDCLRYLIMSGLSRATVKPPEKSDETLLPSMFGETGWMS
jgi:terminase large subunit-like protein